MNTDKYVALDIHKTTTTMTATDAFGQVIDKGVFATTGEMLISRVAGLPGKVRVTLEEGGQAAWAHDILKPHVFQVLVCDPRKNSLLKTGSKNDRIDTRKMCELFRNNSLSAVYHGERSLLGLKNIVRCYDNLVKDCTRTRSRLKALFLGNGLPMRGETLYSKKRRPEWLKQLKQQDRGATARAELLFEELDAQTEIRRKARLALIAETKKHRDTIKLLRTVPGFGLIRAAQALAIIETPHRFRRRPFMKYAGLKVEVTSSSDWEFDIGGGRRRRKDAIGTRGLTRDCSRRMKNVFKGAADTAKRGALADYYNGLVAEGRTPAIARVVLARHLALAMLSLWKRKQAFSMARFLVEHGCVPKGEEGMQ